MSVYEELGIPTLINALGTYTAVGGSRMSEQTLEAMCEAARSYVSMEKLLKAVNRKVAELTRNEAAFLCNSCSTAIYLATAGCVARHYGRPFGTLTQEEIAACEVLALWGQHIPYDHAIEQLGVKLRFIGYPNMEAAFDRRMMETAIQDHTVCCYFAPRTPGGYYGENCMNLELFREIAHGAGVPVLVDGAAQLPPKSNLWLFTREMGCDLACFSGGKDLAGPQASGLLVGKKEYLDTVASLGFPNYGCGRIMKIGREEIIALYTAIRQYVEADEKARLQWCENEVGKLIAALRGARHFSAERTWPNQAGQPLPRAFVALKETPLCASELRRMLEEGTPSILCYSENRPGVYVNPMCLADGEMEQIANRFLELDEILTKGENRK